MPIIKSMPVKQASWSEHYRYLAGKENKLFSWNMSVDPYNEIDITNEFQYNYSFLQNNGKHKNKYYHEVISLPESAKDLSIEESEQILHSLGSKYIDLRAKDNLVVGAIHQDSDKPHLHLMVSANSYLSTKSTRLSKKKFKEVQREVELYNNLKYPSLATNHYKENYRAKNKQKRAEQEIKRAKRQSKKQKVLHDLKLIFQSSSSKKELYQKIKSKKYQLYQRGKYIGLVDMNDSKKRRYRLNTLEQGLKEKFVKKLKSLEQKQKLQNQVKQQITKEKQLNKGVYYGR